MSAMGAGSLTRQGETAMADAEKELAKWTMFDSTGKNERASDLYQRAANAFKGARDWERASQCYQQAGDLQRKLGNEMDSMNLIQSQAECMRNYDPVQAAGLLEDVVIASMATAGRFSQAARLLEKTAESLQKSGKEHKAMELYAQAAQYHFGESANAAGNRCKNNAAQLQAKLALGLEDAGERMEQLNAAVDALIEVGTNCLDSGLTKFSAKGHFLNAGLLVLATGDSVRAERSIESFNDLDYTFGASGEGKFLTALTESVTGGDGQAFTNTVFQYDQIKKLDPWKTSVLLAIKRGLGGAVGGSSTPTPGGDPSTAAAAVGGGSGGGAPPKESGPGPKVGEVEAGPPTTKGGLEEEDEDGEDGLL